MTFSFHRPTDTDTILELISETVSDPWAQAIRSLLAAEIAFGDFRMSPTLAAKTADVAFDIIETGDWMAPRL